MKSLIKLAVHVLGTLSAAFPAAALAAPNAYRCNGCTETQYRTAATATEQLGTRYVYDFAHHNLRKYQVTREPNGGGFTYFADTLSITAAEQDYFDVADEAWNTNNHRMRKDAYLNVSTVQGFPLPSNASAYDIVASGSYQNQLKDWMRYAGLTGGPSYPPSFDVAVVIIYELIRQPGGGIIFPDDDTGTLTLTFVFTNQHKVTLLWKKGTTPVMIEARDGNGNPIPHNSSDLDGHQFHFNGGDGGDATRFANYVHGFGYNVQNICGRTVLACSSAGGDRICVAYPACSTP